MRHEKSCVRCGRKFSCTEHCKTENHEKCMCAKCDSASKDWQRKCDKRYEKVFNPSKRNHKL